MKKNKYIIFSSIAILLSCLTGCNKEMEAAHDKQGFTQLVVYDLGEGKYTANNREASEITVWFKPGSAIANLSAYNKYSDYFTYPGYELMGWYEDENFTKKVDFDNYKLPKQSGEAIRIYAKWDELIDRYFIIHYVNNDNVAYSETTQLEWDVNTPFNYTISGITSPYDEVHTYLGAYKDEAMTQEVDDTYLLTRESGDLPIYTKWIEGNFKIINTPAEFKNSLLTRNLYINKDLDLKNISIDIDKLSNKTILGNGHTITNFTFTTDNKENSKNEAFCGGLINQEIKNCIIKDLNIVDAKYEISSNTAKYFNFGLLAGKVIDSTIENVNISGTVTYSDSTNKRLDNGSLIAVRLKLDQVGYEVTNTTVTNCVFDVKEAGE